MLIEGKESSVENQILKSEEDCVLSKAFDYQDEDLKEKNKHGVKMSIKMGVTSEINKDRVNIIEPPSR